jgi:hypothetical protein
MDAVVAAKLACELTDWEEFACLEALVVAYAATGAYRPLPQNTLTDRIPN